MAQKNSKSKPKPDLSVVVVTPGKYELISSTIQNLRKQTVTKQMEIVIVTSRKEVLGLAEQELKDFLQFQVVEAGEFRTRSKGAFLGIRSAKAPVVTLLENHCYAEPEWAEALIEAHKQPWAAVGPVVGNANPQTINSYVNFCMFYNSFITPIHGREVDSLPWH
ncbi:MAG: glycosyltransferase family 2 protein, partial [Candidatus Poribacteria bacterium]